MTAAQLDQFKKMTDLLVETARVQMRRGQLDLDALENIAKAGGLELAKAQPIIKLILDFWRANRGN